MCRLVCNKIEKSIELQVHILVWKASWLPSESCAPVERFAHLAVSSTIVLGFEHLGINLFPIHIEAESFFLWQRTLGTKSKIHRSPLGTFQYRNNRRGRIFRAAWFRTIAAGRWPNCTSEGGEVDRAAAASTCASLDGQTLGKRILVSLPSLTLLKIIMSAV